MCIYLLYIMYLPLLYIMYKDPPSRHSETQIVEKHVLYENLSFP